LVLVVFHQDKQEQMVDSMNKTDVDGVRPSDGLPPDMQDPVLAFAKAVEQTANKHTGELSDYMLILSVVATAVAIWGAALGCSVTCCRRPLTRIPVRSSSRYLGVLTGSIDR